jgi:DMSO/TMAO reductase YedYZ molybdopterin-dependent catalytic subunit
MTPRGTDWSLAVLVGLLSTTGLLSLISGRTSDAWVFVSHGIGGFVLAAVVVVKLRRVWRRLLFPRQWERRSLVGAAGTVLVLLALVSGWTWSSGGDLFVAGFNLLNWHITLGILLTLMVAWHAWLRAKRPRQRDLADRRQFLRIAGATLGGAVLWTAQRPLAAAAGWRGAERRWTGSYEQGSFNGNAFPATSWVADRPRVLAPETYRLRVGGLVMAPRELDLADLQPLTTITATLDCTGGFYSTQNWHGVPLGAVLEQTGIRAGATHVRVISHTGYRWSFPLAEADDLLLATAVGGEALSHAHGAPLRLVAPGRRGFQWVKWVVRVEVHQGPDRGSALSTVWSSMTPEGRGEA